MPHLLAISSSANLSASVSRRLVAAFVDAFRAQDAAAVTTTRDLGEDPPPHIDEAVIGAVFTPADQRTAAQTQALALSDALVDELVAADVIVIGAPMTNFMISSNLKAWIDHVVRAGRTFSYTANGPNGLLKGKRVIVVTARGGSYEEGSRMRGMDYQEPYLRAALGFIGLDDVTFIHCQGLAMGDRDAAIAQAEVEVAATVQGLAAQARAA